MLDDLIEGIVQCVLDEGLDKLGLARSDATIDLAPVTAAIEELGRHSREMIDVLSHPSQTAGAEACEMAVTALSQGWHDDALRDARRSIDSYPYSATPHLVAGLASVALHRGDDGLHHLLAAVKYSANGQPEIGATAAIVASRLSQAVGGEMLAQRLLADADHITAGRCAAVVAMRSAALSPPTHEVHDRLKQLWWDDHPPADGYSPQTFSALEASTRTRGDYELAGPWFGTYLHNVAELAQDNLAAIDSVATRLVTMRSARQVNVDYTPVKRALRYTSLAPQFGFWDKTVGDLVAKARGLPGAHAWPRDDAWKLRADLPPAALREVFDYTRTACSQLGELLGELSKIATDPAVDEAARSAATAAMLMQQHVLHAVKELARTAESDVVDQANRAWKRYLAVRRTPSGIPVMHLDVLGAVLGSAAPHRIQGDQPSSDHAALSAAADPAGIEATCPGCGNHQAVASVHAEFRCVLCGSDVVVRTCAELGSAVRVLRHWGSWSHQGCPITHPI